MNDYVEKLDRRYQQLNAQMEPMLDLLQEIAEYFQPDRANFRNDNATGEEGRENIFDSTPEDALDQFASQMLSLLTNPSLKWFLMDVAGADIDELGDEAKSFLDGAHKKMLSKFNDEETNFYTSVFEFYKDVIGFGSSPFLVEEDEDTTVRFSCALLSEIRFAENKRKIVDTVARKWCPSAREISQMFDKYSEKVAKALEENPDGKFEIVHFVYPAKEYKGSHKLEDKNFASVYYERETKFVLEEGGFHEMPYLVGRYSKRSGEVVGRGLGAKALPEARVLNEMGRSMLIAGENQAQPTTLLPDDGFIGGFSNQGGSLNYYKSHSGSGIKDRVMTLDSNADLNALQNLVADRRDQIRKIFLNDKIKQVDGPRKSVPEVQAIQNEQYNILGPIIGRFQTDFLGPLIKRVFGIMLRAGEFGQPPEELDGLDIKIEYVSPISRAQKQVESDGLSQAINYLAPISEVDPAVFRHFDFDFVARDTQQLFGFPLKYMKPVAQVEAEDEAAAQRAQQDQETQDASEELSLEEQAAQVDGMRQQQEQ